MATDGSNPSPPGDFVPAIAKPIVVDHNLAVVPASPGNKSSPPMTPVRPNSHSPDVAGMLRALQRRWLLAATLGILFAGAAGVAARYLMPPSKLTARTKLRVPISQSGSRNDAFAGASDQRTHLAMVKSRLVLQSALDMPSVAELKCVKNNPQSVAWLEKAIEADFGTAPEVLSIYLSGSSSHEISTIVTEVRRAYCREVLDKQLREGEKHKLALEKLRDAYAKQVNAAKELQRELLKKSGADTGSRAMRQAWYQTNVTWFQRDLLQVRTNLRQWRAELAVIEELSRAGANAPVSPTLVDDLIQKNGDYQKAQANVREAQSKADDFLKRARRGENDPGFAPYLTSLKSARAALQQMETDLKPVYTEEVKKKRTQDMGSSLSTLRVNISVGETNEKLALESLNAAQKQLEELSDNVVKLEQSKEDISAPEKLVTRLEDDIARLDLTLKLPPAWSVLEECVVTQVSDRKRILMAAGAASLGTFFLICLGIAFWEFRLQRVSSAEQVSFGLGLKLVGTIPDSAPQYPRRRGSVDDPEMQGLFSDAFDATRTMLLRAAKTHSLQVIMMSSAESGEGKTTLSVHLAASLAQVGHKTLLIDADLRNPVAHLVFGIDPSPGLCDVLRVEATLESVVRPTSIPNLSMLTSGIWDSRATRALAHEGTGGLIAELRKQFDFILIDTSPVLPVVDPLLIGQYVDGAILSVMRGKSCMPHVYAAHQRLTGAGIKVLGTVVSGVKSKRYGSAAYYYPNKSGAAAKKT